MKAPAPGWLHPIVLLVALVALQGCQPTVYLMPTPVAMRSGELDPFKANPNLERNNLIRVFYATNRLPREGELGYSRRYDDTIRFGEAVLSIGDEVKPWEWLHFGSTVGERDAEWKIQLNQVDEQAVLGAGDALVGLSPELRRFFSELNARIDASLHRDLTVYVHGANNNFYRASAQAGQYRHFTGYNSVVLAFAWPSAENLLRYGADVRNAAATAPVFARLIDLLARHSTALRLNILAYSAGAMVISPGLTMLKSLNDNQPLEELRRRLRLGEVYFAAPDIELRRFVQDLNQFKDMTCNVTVTINLNDSVLALSQAHQGASRAGRPDLRELSEEETRWIMQATHGADFDVIDVNNNEIPDFRTGSHSFWYSNPWVSSDVLVQFLYHAGPGARGLAERFTGEEDSIWYFPPDYPQRVVEAVKRLDAAEVPSECGYREMSAQLSS